MTIIFEGNGRQTTFETMGADPLPLQLTPRQHKRIKQALGGGRIERAKTQSGKRLAVRPSCLITTTLAQATYTVDRMI